MTPANLPASIRNRNPGAIYPGPSARRFGARATETLVSRDGRHQIASFSDATSGAAALFDNLCHAGPKGGRYYRDKSIDAAIRTWCGGHHAEAYLRVIARRAGLARDTVLDLAFLRDPARVIPLARAMAWQEAGQDFPLDEAGWQAAHARALAYMPEPPEPQPDGDEWMPEAVPIVDAATDHVPPVGGWTPDNDLPSPRPETREAEQRAGSRKWSIVGYMRGALAALGLGSIGTEAADVSGAAPGMIAAVKTFAADNAGMLIAGGVLLGIVATEILRELMRDDAVSGRYRPEERDDR